MKVAVIGAAGGIGQSLSLILKTQLPKGSELTLYDIAAVTPGIAVDLSHIPTDVTVKGFFGKNSDPALKGTDIVLISAGLARQPGMDRSDLFNFNAGIIQNLVEKCAKNCPEAMICIITNPVNSMVPIAAQTLKECGVYDKRKLFGVTSLDVIRAEAFVAETKKCSVAGVDVKVIGGHSSSTILPLLSQVKGIEFSDCEVIALTKRIQNAGTEVLDAKNGGGSATLSMAQAAARFALSLVDALQGKSGIVECAYVEGDGQYTSYFAQPVLLGRNGVEGLPEIGPTSTFEQEALDKMLEQLHKDIKHGEEFTEHPHHD